MRRRAVDRLPRALAPPCSQPRYTRLLGSLADRRFYLLSVRARVRDRRCPRSIVLIAELQPNASRAIPIGGAVQRSRDPSRPRRRHRRDPHRQRRLRHPHHRPRARRRRARNRRDPVRPAADASRHDNFFAIAFSGRGSPRAPLLTSVTCRDARRRVLKTVRYA